jgi:hypothetical protein
MTHQATQLPVLSDPTDRERLNLLFRTKGDTVSFVSLRHEDPLDTLAWLNQPHIQPWHAAIATAFREHRESDTHQALSRSLRDVTRILDLEANSTLRIRAVNAIIRLANAMKRSSSLPAAGRAGVGLADIPSAPSPRAAKELHHAQERVLDELSRLSINLERRAENKNDLEDAKAPIGTVPSWARNPLPAPSQSGQSRAEAGLANTSSAPGATDLPSDAPDRSGEKRRESQPLPPPARHASTEIRKSKIENPLTLSRGCPIPPSHKPRPRRRKPRAP